MTPGFLATSPNRFLLLNKSVWVGLSLPFRKFLTKISYNDGETQGPHSRAARRPSMGLHCRGVGAGPIAKKLAEAKYKERGTLLAEETSWPRCPHSWACSRPTWRHLPVSTSRKSGGNLSSPCSSWTHVSPLSGSAPLWKRILVCDGGGGWEAFRCDLGIQKMEACVAPTPRKGGLFTLEGLQQDASKGRGPIRPGCQLWLFDQGHEETRGTWRWRRYPCLQSAPAELSADRPMELQLAGRDGYVTVGDIKARLRREVTRWDTCRRKGRPGWPLGPCGRLTMGCQLSWQTPPPRPVLLRPEEPCPDPGGVEGGMVAGREKTD